MLAVCIADYHKGKLRMMDYTQEQLAELRKLLERNHATEDGFLTTREAGAVAYFVGFVEQLIRQRNDEM